MKKTVRILVIETSAEERAELRAKLEAAPGLECKLTECVNGESAIGESVRIQPDCVILGHARPGKDGAEWLSRFHAGRPPGPIPVVLISDKDGEKLALAALGFGAQDYLLRSELTPENLQRAIVNAIERVRSATEIHELLHSKNTPQASTEPEQSPPPIRIDPLRVREALARSTDVEALLPEIASLLVPSLAELCLIDLFDDAGILSRRATAHADLTLDRIARQTIGEIHGGEHRSPYCSRPLADSLQTGRAVLQGEEVTAHDVSTSLQPAALKIAETLAPRSLMVLPLITRGRALGTLTLARGETVPPFGADDVAAAEAVTGLAAWAIEAAQLRKSLGVAERRTDDFLAKLTHELRNPLAPLKNAVQILRLRGSEAETRAWAQEIMERQVEQLVSSIERCIGSSQLFPAANIPAPEDALPEPAPARAASSAHAEPSKENRRRRVLVVDDNQDVAQSLAMVVDLCGHEVEVAHDGPEALDKAKQVKPDVVFLDIGLPGMDGYEVARAIRAETSLARTLLVALTGYGTDEVKRKSAEAGFNHHLLKPVSFETVENLLAQLTQ